MYELGYLYTALSSGKPHPSFLWISLAHAAQVGDYPWSCMPKLGLKMLHYFSLEPF